MDTAGLPANAPPPRRERPEAKEFMVIRPDRESTRGWTRPRQGTRATSHPALNEHGLALNVFWLPEIREEGVRRRTAPAERRQTGLTPRPGVPRWNQMGD